MGVYQECKEWALGLNCMGSAQEWRVDLGEYERLLSGQTKFVPIPFGSGAALRDALDAPVHT